MELTNIFRFADGRLKDCGRGHQHSTAAIHTHSWHFSLGQLHGNYRETGNHRVAGKKMVLSREAIAFRTFFHDYSGHGKLTTSLFGNDARTH
jgi:hypothetical protein